MKSLMLFLQPLLADAGSICHTSTQLDYEYIQSRYEHEGMSFLTISLPAFADDLHRSLANECVDPSAFPGFGRRGQLPRFLGGLLDQVFDRWSGRLLDEPNIAAIQALRQVTMAFGKIKLECSDERIQAALQAYIECERNVRAGDRARSLDTILDYRRMAHLLWRSLNSRLDRRIYNGELIPAHGPGATADRKKGNKKYVFNEYSTRLDAVFPYGEHCLPSWSLWWHTNHVDFREPGNERPVRVIHVPKTLKTPRIIACEPSYMMFLHKGLLDLMQEEMRFDNNALNFVCFDSQEPNQLLAKEGSLYGDLATLDLKEASDRVSNQLVKELFHYFPHSREGVEAVRSRSADVSLNGQIVNVRLAKYASMGSGLTFPLEAMVFCTIVMLGIESALNRQLTQKDLTALYGKVRVYGDDIVVPVEYVSSVMSALERYGAIVNTRKSFWTGRFRESCGADFYAGRPVTVARVRWVFPKSRKDAKELVSTVSLRNQLFELGYEMSVAYLDRLLRKKSLLGKHFPVVTRESSALGRWAHGDPYEVHRMHEDQQRPLVKAYVAKSRIPKNEIDGTPALLKVFLKRSQKPFEDKRHLERSGRPSVVDIELKWVRCL
jgi:hypothetical protein